MRPRACAGRPSAPAGLVDVQRSGAPHPAEQLFVRRLERVPGTGEDRVDRAGADPRAEQLLAQLDQVTARDTVADRQRRDRRLKAWPERAGGDLPWQLGSALKAAAGSARAGSDARSP